MRQDRARNGPLVTAAVAVRDRRAQMLRCLDALLAQGYRPLEILVLDNESTDGTAQAVEQRAATAPVPVRVVRVPGTLGRVRNHAVELARGEVLAFTDSDCVPEAGWVSAGVAALTGDDGLGVVQGRTRPDLAPGERIGRWAATQSIEAETLRFECCNLFYRLDAIRGSDGFDEEVGFFGEDMAAGWAVRRQGWRTAFAADAVVRHAVTHPGFRWHLHRAQRYGNFAALVRRYPELRSDYLWGRVFLRPRNAAFFAAVVGVAAAARRPSALALAAPYAWWRRPRAFTGPAVRAALEGTLFDGAVLLGLLRGTVRHRRIVL